MTVPNNDTAWSFTLRNHGCAAGYDSDSDSDTETAYSTAVESANRLSDEAKLLQEMDLSSRKETVVYKPNPFSLAKIAAASRAKRLEPIPVSSNSSYKEPSVAQPAKKQQDPDICAQPAQHSDTYVTKSAADSRLTSYMRPKAKIHPHPPTVLSRTEAISELVHHKTTAYS